MARIGIKNIDEILLNILPMERRYDSKEALSIAPEVKDMYLKNGYDLMPKTREEADARGAKNFNGLASSFTGITVYQNPEKTIVSADIAPTRYLIGEAMRDVIKTGVNFTQEDIKRLSPDMANVSLIVPVEFDGEYYLLSQIKGKALGSGQLHSGLVAGNVDAKYLYEKYPLTATLKAECSEELGIDLSRLDSTSFTFMIDERETGQVNFASVARDADIESILKAYEANTKNKLEKAEELEVMALSMLPIAGISLIPIDDGNNELKGIRCYLPTNDGLKETIQDRTTRPYTDAVIEYISNDSNLEFLLEKAGI